MKTGTKQKFYLQILLFIIFFLTALTPVSAQETETKTIRVAYPVQARLTDYDDSGLHTGYTYEYLEEIAQYTGWNYEFVSPDTGDIDQDLNMLLEMLKEGKIDLMGGIEYIDSLAEEYNYSAYSYGTVYTVLQALYDSDLNIVSASIPQTFRIAVAKSSVVRRQELEEYCKINKIQPVYIECDNMEAQIDALQSGEADLLLNTSMNYLENFRTVAKFAARPFYFITTKGNTEITEALDSAIVNIDQATPTYAASLYEKYFESPNSRLSLSAKEREYIAHAGVLKVGVLTSYPPYQYEDGGEYKGIAVDLLRFVSQKTGLQFDWVPADSPEELFRLSVSGRVDLIAGMPYSYKTAQENNLSMTRPFISSQYLLVMNHKLKGTELRGRKLALPAESAYQGEFLGTRVTYDTISECVEAISDGDADYTYLDANMAQYYLNQPKYRSLKLIPQSYEPRQVCFGIIKTAPRELLSVCNKVILTISEIDLQTIINQNVLQKQNLSLKDYIRENPFEVVLFTVCGAVVIIAVLLIFLYKRAKANKAKKLELEKHYKIYALTRDFFLEYNYSTRKMLVAIPAGEENEEQKIMHYDFSVPPASEEAAVCRNAFLKILYLKKRCIQEVNLPCIDGKNHWLRFALDMIYDNGTPAFAVGKINLIDEEKNKEEKLLKKAQLDSLTHIFNPETTQQKIDETLRTMPEQYRCALLILDIDHFKSINDTCGHMCGDETLQKVSGLLKEKFCPENIVGRIGGDEFIIYIKHTESVEQLTEICNALLDDIHQIKSGHKSITVSLGGAFSAAGGKTYETFYKVADEMLYQAKKEGRDRTRIREF